MGLCRLGRNGAWLGMLSLEKLERHPKQGLTCFLTVVVWNLVDPNQEDPGLRFPLNASQVACS
jgi:hypothetical protein